MICRGCLSNKPLEDYYKQKRTSTGRMYICKDCHKARMRLRRRENPSVRAYDVARAKLPDRRAHMRKVADQWRRDNPLGYKAQTAVGNAIRDGRLVKQPCRICGDPKVHAHHEDYAKPLDVDWLCALHHHRYHADGMEEAPCSTPAL